MVVALVPVGIFVFLLLVQPVRTWIPSSTGTLGQVASVAAVIMMILGFYVIRRIVTIEL